jgi:hypothetical protein
MGSLPVPCAWEYVSSPGCGAADEPLAAVSVGGVSVGAPYGYVPP